MSQLMDLHQKLSKAQSVVGTTRPVAPTLKDKDPATKVNSVLLLSSVNTDLHR